VPLADPLRVRLIFVFLLGSCLAVFSRQIRLDGRIAAVAIAVFLVTLRYGHFFEFGLIALAYLCLWAAAVLPVSWRRVGRVNDYSYGLYVYGFLVEQSLAAAGVIAWGFVPYLGLALLITAACAWLSWHGIEKRAMALKELGPGRGFRYWIDAVRRRRPAVAPLPIPVPEPEVDSAT
jgi:peptidoglycan/LPS O-acetylase OafA/YrhL